VYKARDTRLDRTVAIKILPQSLAADPQFRDRFDREARLYRLVQPLEIVDEPARGVCRRLLGFPRRMFLSCSPRSMLGRSTS